MKYRIKKLEDLKDGRFYNEYGYCGIPFSAFKSMEGDIIKNLEIIYDDVDEPGISYAGWGVPMEALEKII